MKSPKIIDNDRDEIRAEYEGESVRSWSYKTEGERREKMGKAQEFAEGWFVALARAKAEGRFTRRQKAPEGLCTTCDNERRVKSDFHPPHDASPECSSGGRPHCSCDVCF